MTTLETIEARALADSVRAACDRLATEQRVREIAYAGSGFDADLWRTLCSQVGIAAIMLPETLGGADGGAAALGVIAHELGRALAPVPFLASAVLSTGILLDTSDLQRVSALAAGDRTATCVLTDGGGAWRPDDVTISATRRDDTWVLDGTAQRVLHAAGADDLIVVAATGTGRSILVIDHAADGVSIEPRRVLDPTRPMARVRFDAAVAHPLAHGDRADQIIEQNALRAMAVLCAEQVGTHERVLEVAIDYSRTRTQFGRPIGSFQAIKHRCADMLVDLEWARSASLAALQAIDAGSPDSAWLTSMAKAVCSEGLRDASHANLQIHGGLGFTWEDSAHLYLKRARTDEVLFGGPGTHWTRVGDHIGLA